MHTKRRIRMDGYESLSHAKWECKYHVVLIAKCRRKTLYGALRKHLGEVFPKLAERRDAGSKKSFPQSDGVTWSEKQR